MIFYECYEFLVFLERVFVFCELLNSIEQWWLASLGLAKVALHLFTNEIICLVSWCGLLSGPCICYYYMFIYKKNCRLLQCLYTYLFLRTHAQIQLIGGDFFDSKLWNAWIFYSILFTAWKIPVYSTSAMFKEVH